MQTKLCISIPGDPQVTPVFASVQRPRPRPPTLIGSQNQNNCNNAQRYQPTINPPLSQCNKSKNQKIRPPQMVPPIGNFHNLVTQANHESVQYQHQQEQKMPPLSIHTPFAQSNTQHQQQYPSRIPTMTQNSPNRISKTATNLLNEIYERHLLTQTTFESVSDVPANGKCIGKMREHSVTGANSTARPEPDFNFNNLRYQEVPTVVMGTHFASTQPNNIYETNTNSIAMLRNIEPQLQQQREKFTSNKNVKIKMPKRTAATSRGGDGDSKTTFFPLHYGREIHHSDREAAEIILATTTPQQMIRKRISFDQNPARKYSYADAANEKNIPCTIGYLQMQPSIIENNIFYGSSAIHYNGHGKRFNGKMNSDDSSQHQYTNNGKIGMLKPTTKISGNSCCLERGQPVGGNCFEDSSAPSPLAFLASTESAKASVFTAAADRADSGGISTSATNCEYTSNSKINIMLETAQAMAAAAYFARAAQRMANNNAPVRSRIPDMPNTDRGGFCGALQRAPPPMPAGLARRLANKENYGLGKVKVMLRISDSAPADSTQPHYLCIDKKKRQITLTDPATLALSSAAMQERGPMVAAPKIFAFDNLFTHEDAQNDVSSSALSEVIPAVLEGTDGCLLTLGYPNAGQSRTMFGSVSPAQDLGAIPCAIAWLYKGINERRQKTGARFSVRVSALGVNATKPGTSSRDLLAAHATDSDESPGVYLRDDFLGGPTELRAPTAERAALFLDAALAGRHQGGLEPALIFTLHVYQYSLAGKGGVAGGRSRLHLIDLGGCANRSGGLPLSGVGNILLAILSGQRHPPNRDHPLTPLLKDCLAPLTCHVSVLAHISHSQTHTDALTTVQLASRIHRMRRRKHRLPLPADKSLGPNIAGNLSGSSDGPDPSSSDLSADTVIYIPGPNDDATDGEHPPVYIPSLNSGDNRCSMNKALKGSCAEKPSKLPQKKSQKPQSPVPNQRTDSLKRRLVASSSPVPCEMPTEIIPSYQYNASILPQTSVSLPNSPKIISGMRHAGSHIPSPKGSPLRRPNVSNQNSPKRQVVEEQWVDGPRLSKSKVAEARHLMREINHVKQCETWIDGPKMSPAKSLAVGSLLGLSTQTYGYMDNHKKSMIRQWVENQSNQVFPPSCNSSTSTACTNNVSQLKAMQIAQLCGVQSDEEEICIETTLNEITESLCGANKPTKSTEISIRMGSKLNQELAADKFEMESVRSAVSSQRQHDSQEDEDQDSGPSEVPPALPLIEPLSSREISHDSIHIMCSRHVSRENLGLNVQTIDCGLQVTEEEIARAMGCDHPLSALSHCNMSVVSSFNAGGVGDAFSDCIIGERTKHQFDQLARLRELYTSQLAMAEVTPNYQVNHAGSVFSEPAFRFISGPGSVCSEPAYRPPSPRCRDCRQSMTLSRTPSQSSLPSLNGIVAIAGMEQYASLRHPDGASDPNIKQKSEQISSNVDSKIAELLNEPPTVELIDRKVISHSITPIISQTQLPQLPPLCLTTPEAYDSGHDSSTPRTSKHSGISRRAESGYHSVATVRDSDDSSFGSGVSRAQRITAKKRNRQDKSLCNWLKNPFTCTYPDTEGEISDF